MLHLMAALGWEMTIISDPGVQGKFPVYIITGQARIGRYGCATGVGI